jgi:tripartite-type tricarboxylate transporter receptor subunit TctC
MVMGRVLVGICVAIGLNFSALAQSNEDEAAFFKGKSTRLIVGTGPGDGFDFYARLLVRHFYRHIPGQPSMTVQNMQGAGSLNALNFIQNVAPRDGTTMGLIIPVATTMPLLRPDVARFDPRTINWIGSVAGDYFTCGVWTADNVTLKDLQSREFIMGSTAVGGSTSAGARIFAEALGLKLKLVPGYRSMNDLNFAAEKGEVAGHCGLMATSLKTTLWQAYESGRIKIVLRAGMVDDPALPNIPNAFDLAKTDEDRQLLLLLAGPWYYGRPVMAPPDLPPARLAALRKAFRETMEDPAFLADAKQLNAVVQPLSAEEIVKTVTEIYKIPETVIARARPLFGVD